MNETVTSPAPAQERTEGLEALETHIETVVRHRLPRAVRVEMKKMILRFVVPAFLVAGLGSAGAFFLVWHDTMIRSRDAYCVMVHSRNDIRSVIDTVAGSFPGPIAAQIHEVTDRKFPPLDPKKCDAG